MVTATLFGYFTVSAAVVPLVVQVVMAPLREVRIALAFAALKRRWRTFVACTLAVIAWTLVGTVLFVVPGVVVAISHALYAPVVMVEGTGVRDALKRARRLAKRFWSTVLVITVVQFTLPVLVWIASVDSSWTLKFDEHFSPKQFGFEFRMGGTSTLYQLFNILVAPLAAIMGAQLYLKTRFAGGEVLSDAVTQFEALDIPRSRWQARMRRTTTMN